MSQITCSTVPSGQYVLGMIQAYFSRELTFSPLILRQSDSL
jgi:hypothetical protein